MNVSEKSKVIFYVETLLNGYVGVAKIPTEQALARSACKCPLNFAVTIMDRNGMFSRPIRRTQPGMRQITDSLQILLTLSTTRSISITLRLLTLLTNRF